MRLILDLYRSMSPRRRRQLMLTLVVMLVGAVAELMTIGAALPFLALIAEPERSGVPAAVLDWLSFAGGNPLIGAAALLILAAVAAACIRLLLVWLSQNFVLALGHDIATRIFGRTLRQPYADYVRRNSSEILGSLEKIRNVAFQVLQPAMQGVIASTIALFVLALLFAIDPFASTMAAVSVAAVYLAISFTTRRRLARNSTVIAWAATERTKIVQEGLGGMRDILLDRSQPLFEERFRQIDRGFCQALARNAFFGAAPRFVIEAAGIAAIAMIAVAMSLQPGGIVKAIPVLGALVLGAQRLLPLLQQAYLAWSQFLGNRQSFADLVELMHAPVLPDSDRSAGDGSDALRGDIVFSGVSFRYQHDIPVLRDIDFTFEQGACTGIAGATGSGKSTLLDLLMGLLEPSSGEIFIGPTRLSPGNRADWQSRLAHVPQSIYLADDSIAANIAFGAHGGAIDPERVREAARAAQLDAFVERLPEGYETRVGERGVRLSGGQRQRIGIARALYRKPSVLILDEATSALDDQTEAAVIESVMRLRAEMTIVMVAHRRSTLAVCDRVAELRGGAFVSPPAPVASPGR